MRDHIKKAPARSEPFDLNAAVDEVIEMVQSAIIKNRVLVRATLNGLPTVHGDRVQLQQVVLNLILNAIEAMSSVEQGSRELSISTQQAPSGEILVGVQDFRAGNRSGASRPGFRALLHHQECWNWNGTLDLPIHHHRPRRSAVGRGQSDLGALYFSSRCRQARKIHEFSSCGFPESRAERRQRSRWSSSTGLAR